MYIYIYIFNTHTYVLYTYEDAARGLSARRAPSDRRQTYKGILRFIVIVIILFTYTVVIVIVKVIVIVIVIDIAPYAIVIVTYTLARAGEEGAWGGYVNDSNNE